METKKFQSSDDTKVTPNQSMNHGSESAVM